MRTPAFDSYLDLQPLDLDNTQMDQPSLNRRSPNKIDWLEFCVRFVCGAVFGMFLGLRFVLYWWLSENHVMLGLVNVGVMLACGFLAARYGDRFWGSLSGR